MMALILGINAMAHDCCDVKNNEKCDCPIEKKLKIPMKKLKIQKIIQKQKQKK